MGAIIKKELKAYFLSPIAYIFIGLFLIINSIFFYFYVYLFSSVKFSDVFYSPSVMLSPATMLIFIIPILTMRMFAEERKNGTDILLYTSPRSVTSIVMGKFVASMIVVFVYEISTLIYYGILSYFGTPNFSEILIAFLGFSLLAMSYISFGMFISSITENQIIAVFTTMVGLLIMCIIPEFFEKTRIFSLINIFGNTFPNGIITIQGIILFISFTAVFTILTVFTISKRKCIK